MNENKSRATVKNDEMLRMLLYAMFIGFVGVLFYSLQNQSTFFSFFSFGIFIACASAMVGGLFGFLFGIPKTLPATNDPTTKGPGYQPNTNLEQISDWLTKILVGVGLTQLNERPTLMKKASTFLAGGFGSPDSGAFALTILAFFVVCGFLFSFLWTRLYLPAELRDADLTVVAAQVDEIKNQNTKDATALCLANHQLNPSSQAPAPNEKELNIAIKEASEMVKVTIFNQAQNIRRENWENNKEKMELTIPIFRALIASDEKDETHLYHGQLGFALKDQRKKQDWSGAEQELTQAIKIRDNKKESGWLIYEFNRAICRINQDEGYTNKPKTASKPDAKQKILEDLHAAAARSDNKALILTNNDIKEWMGLNNVDEKEFDH